MNARHWWSLSTVKWDLDYSSCWQQTEPLKYVNVSDYWDAFLCLFWTSAIKPRFQKHHVAANRRYLSSACCLQTGPLWMMSCFVPAFICCSCYWSLRSLNLACFTFTSPSWLRAVLLLELTAQFCLFSSLITRDGWTVIVWLAYHSGLCINVKSVSFFKKASPGWCLYLWPRVYYRAYIWIPVWAASSVWGVSVWTCPSMRMFLQHFFTKDPYLWTMLCLCCKLALPTTQLCELISFS